MTPMLLRLSLGDYLTTADASATYATQESLGNYLTTEAADKTYATQESLAVTSQQLMPRQPMLPKIV